MTRIPDILEEIARDARRLRVGQQFPPHVPLTWDQVERVQQDLEFMLEQGVTMDRLAKALGDGFSRGTLRRFRNLVSLDNPGIDVERIARGINEFLELVARRKQAKRPTGFVETEAAKKMLAVIGKTIELCSIGLIIGDSGRGKSMTLEAATGIWVGSILVRVRQSTRTPMGLARHLGACLRLRGLSRGHEAEAKVIEALHGTGRALLIDEAHQLRHEALELLRDIHDETGCPIVLVGTVKLSDAVNDAAMFYGQFASRIALRYDLTEDLSLEGDGGGSPLHTIDEVRNLYESDRVRFTDDGLILLTKIANLPGLGGLRLCSKLVQVAATVARSRSAESIDAELLLGVLRMLQGEAHGVGTIGRAIESSKVMVA